MRGSSGGSLCKGSRARSELDAKLHQQLWFVARSTAARLASRIYEPVSLAVGDCRWQARACPPGYRWRLPFGSMAARAEDRSSRTELNPATFARFGGSQAAQDDLGGSREIEVCDRDVDRASPIVEPVRHLVLAQEVGTARLYAQAGSEAVPNGTRCVACVRFLGRWG